MNNDVKIGSLVFSKFISNRQLAFRVEELALQIKKDHSNSNPIFVILLNGAFVFAADLLRHFEESIETFFLKISSYHDLESSGLVSFDKEKLKSLKGRTIVLVEDIVDTGTTMNSLLLELKEMEVAKVSICTLLLKPNKLKYNLQIDYVGFEIADEFVVGYGLDFNDKARNLKDIFQLKSEKE